MNEIRVGREILAAGGPDILVYIDAEKYQLHNQDYDAFLLSDRSEAELEKARNAIGTRYVQGATQSSTGELYKDNYGNSCKEKLDFFKNAQ